MLSHPLSSARLLSPAIRLPFVTLPYPSNFQPYPQPDFHRVAWIAVCVHALRGGHTGGNHRCPGHQRQVFGGRCQELRGRRRYERLDEGKEVCLTWSRRDF